MKKLSLLIYVMLVALFVSHAEVEVPKFTHQYVNDYGELLSQSEEQIINRMLRTYEDSTTNQLMVLTLSSNDYENELTLFDYSQKVFVTWGIGQKGKNNGVLIVLVKNPNPSRTPQVRIVTGYGVEGPLPDVVCKRIIRSSRPLINDGHYYEGINLILGEIITKIDKEFTADKDTEKGLPTWAKILIGLIIIVIIGLIVYVLSSTSGSDEPSCSSTNSDRDSDDDDSNSRRRNRNRDRSRDDDDDNNRNIFIASSFSSSNDSYGGSDSGGGSDSSCDCGGGDGGGGGGGD